jgi:hypothetical protein
MHCIMLNATRMRFFVLNWFGQQNPSELLINQLTYFRFWLQIRWDIHIFLHSMYSQTTGSFIPHIISIRKFSFCVSVYGQLHFAYYLQMLSFSRNETHIPHVLSMSWTNIISIPTISFNVLSAKAKFFLRASTYSTNYQYALNFLPHIISIT